MIHIKFSYNYRAMLSLSRSVPWPEAMFAMTGEYSFSASAILDYFSDLRIWLQTENSQVQENSSDNSQ